MAVSSFSDKSHPPSEKDLAKCLGPAAPLWRRVRDDLATRVPDLRAEWGYSGPSMGWGLRLKKGSRVILYLTPQERSFLASTAIGEKAVRTASERAMPVAFRRLLDAAPRFAEGRGVRQVVKKMSDLKNVAALVSLKLEV